MDSLVMVTRSSWLVLAIFCSSINWSVNIREINMQDGVWSSTCRPITQLTSHKARLTYLWYDSTQCSLGLKFKITVTPPLQHNTVKIIYHLAWLCFIFFLQQCCLYWNIFTSKLELCKLSAKDMWTMIILMMHLFVVHFGAISWQCKRVSSINQFSFPSTNALLKRQFCFQNIRG